MSNSTLSVKYLCLDKFRNYNFLELELNPKPVIITGVNGSGKTSILEALSLLSPGTGFRNSKLSDMDNNHFNLPWCIDAKLETIYGTQEIQTARTSVQNEDKRIVQIDGNFSKSRAELAKIFSVIWLTPQMDQLFINSRSERLKFFDQLVVNFEASHLSYIAKYEHNMRERLKLLKENYRDESWLNVLEKNMSELGVSIASARIQAIEYLQESINDGTSYFPKANLNIDGLLESKINEMPALQLEEFFCVELKNSRKLDGLSGRTTKGVHKSDFCAVHLDKGMPARLCSTGEQKALLISIILAEARARLKWRSATPVLLLDEIIAHLDREKREEFFEEILELGAQTWITGTDKENFANLKSSAQFFKLAKGKVLEEAQ